MALTMLVHVAKGKFLIEQFCEPHYSALQVCAHLLFVLDCTFCLDRTLNNKFHQKETSNWLTEIEPVEVRVLIIDIWFFL